MMCDRPRIAMSPMSHPIAYRARASCSLPSPECGGGSLTEIGGCAFYGCGKLSEVKIPASVKIIGGKAFDECASLARVLFVRDSLLERVGSLAFPRRYDLTVAAPTSIVAALTPALPDKFSWEPLK
jgi:hypothetical protein